MVWKTWFYQLTHLYHGCPGTGKSIIASAIARRYNLHIIKIKLSVIKDNREFIKVFKHWNFGRKIDFKDIYFIDEIDIELEKLLDNNKEDNKIIKKLKKNINENLDKKMMMTISDDDSDSSDTEDNMLSC